MSLRNTLAALVILAIVAIVLMGDATAQAAVDPGQPTLVDSSTELETLRETNRRLIDLVNELQREVDRYDDPMDRMWPSDPNELVSLLGCFEDSVPVQVLAVVLPDNGVEPGLDWEPASFDYVGCVAVDDIYTR